MDRHILTFNGGYMFNVQTHFAVTLILTQLSILIGSKTLLFLGLIGLMGADIYLNHHKKDTTVSK